MRLINARTLEMQNLVNGKVPPYVVLSHRWEGAESTLQDFTAFLRMSEDEKTAMVSELQQSRNGLGAGHKPTTGILKVLEFCDVVRENEYQWAWIDTVCIDKTNNAELSEAINSMYRWYRESSVCFVFITDMHPDNNGNLFVRHKAFERSKWFTRGWTLQELIAPREMTFYGPTWEVIGTRLSLANYIWQATGIPELVLRAPDKAQLYSSAARMSWAARREVTREEDIAYCLLGLFDVNMELLYGEGAQRAFRRLQMKILEEYDDETLLVWDMTGAQSIARAHVQITGGTPEPDGMTLIYEGECALTGALAHTPRQFERAALVKSSNAFVPSGPMQMTSWGLKFKRHTLNLDDVCIRVRTVETTMDYGDDEYTDPAPVVMLIPLACSDLDPDQRGLILVVSDNTAKHDSILCRVVFPNPSKRKIPLDLVQFLARTQSMQASRLETRVFLRISWPNKQLSWQSANQQEEAVTGIEIQGQVSGERSRLFKSMRIAGTVPSR